MLIRAIYLALVGSALCVMTESAIAQSIAAQARTVYYPGSGSYSQCYLRAGKDPYAYRGIVDQEIARLEQRLFMAGAAEAVTGAATDSPQATAAKVKKLHSTVNFSNANLDRRRKELASHVEGLLVELREASLEVGPDLEGESVTLPVLQRVIGKLVELSDEATGAHHEFRESAKNYDENLKSAKLLYINAHDECRRFASESQDSEAQNLYSMFADTFSAVSQKIDEQRAMLAPAYKGVNQSLTQIESLRQALSRIDALFGYLPDPALLADSPSPERLLTAVKPFVDSMDLLRVSLEGFNSAIQRPQSYSVKEVKRNRRRMKRGTDGNQARLQLASLLNL